MQKDVIYIDVDDDITAIISKIKDSKEKVIALVPPKRIGILQSSVNLRLLSRTAKQTDKHLAIVTSDNALTALAAAAGIPIAKTLQAKPEIAENTALRVDDNSDDDIIDGSSIPIGDHARQSTSDDIAKEARSAEMASVLKESDSDDAPSKSRSSSRKSATLGKKKVPNFNTFRKKLIIGITLGVALIAFLIWAFVFAGRATIVLKAKTSNESINVPVKIIAGATTSAGAQTIKATAQTQTDEKTVNFTPTGTKDAGEAATGTVKFSTSSLAGLGTVPAGTQLQSTSGLIYTTDSAVTLSYTGGSSVSGTTTITATDKGSKYNAASGSMNGAPSGVSATLMGPTSGGITKMVRVVTQADIDKAKKQITDQSTDSVRSSLAVKFPQGSKVIDQSFNVDYRNISSQPGVDAEAETASVKMQVVYTLYGIIPSDLDSFLNASLNEKINGQDNQHIYKNGANKVVLQDVSKIDNGASATLVATAQIGPKINEDDVKQQVLGMRYGEVQQRLEQINGIDKVEVKFFPFWVSKVPNDVKKVSVEFTIDESN